MQFVSKKPRFKTLFIVPALLLVPFFGNFFSTEVNWTPFDLLVAAGLLILTGLMLEAVLRRPFKNVYRNTFIGLTLTVFLLVWTELAVGIF